jgi:hypothetical protein
MTSPQLLHGIKTGLTCLNGNVTCFTTVVVTHCGCVRWEYHIDNGSKEMVCMGLDWTNSARLKERRGTETNMAMQWHTQMFYFFGGGGGWPWGCKQFIFDFKNNVMKIMSKSPNRHPIRLHEKLRLTEKEKKKSVNSLVCVFFNIPSANFIGGFRLKCKSCQPFDVIVCIKSVLR